MNLDVHFMALLIAYYMSIQQFQMERIYLCLKCCIKCDVPTYVKYVAFQSPTYMKAPLFEHPFYI